MLFTIFLIIAAWILPLPQWIQICLTVFGSLSSAVSFGRSLIRAIRKADN